MATLLWTVAWGGGARLGAQVGVTDEAVGADSVAAVERAHAAQISFERARLRWMPRDRLGFSGGTCDERVGRMCLRLEGGADWWWPASENPNLTAAREGLIDELARLGRIVPGDAWVLGQRVVYLGEAGRWREALAVARACAVAARWWCAALEGLVLHVRGDYVAADRAFQDALAAMSPAEAGRWRDVEGLLDGDGRGARARASASGDSAATARFWRLSDPLFLVEGNDRRTEHFARRTWARTREGARNPYGMSWGWDLDRLLLRYGWEVGWERRDPATTTIGERTTAVGHQDPRSLSYVAPAVVWEGPGSGGVESVPHDWNPGSRTRPRTGYAPAYAPTFLDLMTFVATIPRGDSALLVVRVAGLPDDTTFHADHGHPPAPDPTGFVSPHRSPRHGLFAASLGADTEVYGSIAPGVEGTRTLMVPAGDYVVSVETWLPERGRAGRMRRGLHVPEVPPDVAALSDLLLANARGPVPDALADLLDDLTATPTFAPGDTVRIGWEVHGLGWRPEMLDYRITAREGKGGLWSRLGRAIGVGGDRDGVELAWSEPGPTRRGPVFRALDLVLPLDLDEGRYVVRLDLASTARATLVRERTIEVVPRVARR